MHTSRGKLSKIMLFYRNGLALSLHLYELCAHPKPETRTIRGPANFTHTRFGISSLEPSSSSHLASREQRNAIISIKGEAPQRLKRSLRKSGRRRSEGLGRVLNDTTWQLSRTIWIPDCAGSSALRHERFALTATMETLAAPEDVLNPPEPVLSIDGQSRKMELLNQPESPLTA